MITVGQENAIGNRERAVAYNYRRTNRIASYRKHNLSIVNDFKADIAARELIFGENVEIPKECVNWLTSVQNCCLKCVFRRPNDTNVSTLVGGIMCKHKLCFICNSERSRTMRRRFKRWLEKNMFADKKTGEVFSREQFNWMHLVLTVPHKGGKYKGEEFYLDRFNKEFGEVLRSKWFKKSVFGGATNFEFTHNEHGFHIHNHTLLLQQKTGNDKIDEMYRNWLYLRFLEVWNRITTDKELPVEEFSEKRRAGLRKSLGFLDDETFEAVMRKLDARGSTFIGLESLYVRRKTSVLENGVEKEVYSKRYVNTSDLKDFSAGLMECLKYSFKPFSLFERNGEGGYTYKLDTVMKLLPLLHGRKLYRKFGNLYGVADLNVLEEKPEDLGETMETLEETADEAIHPVSLQKMDKAEYHYVSCPVNQVIFKPDKERFTVGVRWATVLHGHDLEKVFESLMRVSITDRGESKRDFVGELEYHHVKRSAKVELSSMEGFDEFRDRLQWFKKTRNDLGLNSSNNKP